MKKIPALILVLCMFLVLTACGSSNVDELSIPEEDIVTEGFLIPLGDTGAKVAIPAEMGFERYESELNEFYGGGPNGEWRIIANTELKSDYTDCTLADYCALSAKANGGEAGQDADGNHYFTYTNEVSADEVYRSYTAVREGAEKYYRISFYCFSNLWDNYDEKFSEWATTIEVE
jgi:hypothetical protein